MDTTSSVVLTGVIVTTGQWAKGKGITPRILLGLGFVAISLAVISQINDDLARGFALLIVLLALMMYGVPIAQKMGFAK